MPNKPDKFGIKFWMAADAQTKYMLHSFPYFSQKVSMIFERPQSNLNLRICTHHSILINTAVVRWQQHADGERHAAYLSLYYGPWSLYLAKKLR